MYKIDVDTLKTVPLELKKLSNIVKMKLLKTVHDQLLKKVNGLEGKMPSTNTLVIISQYDTDK